VAVWGLAFCLSACAAIFVWAANKGFDLASDGFYIASVASPFSYHIAASEFAYIWYPIYKLLGGSIAGLRLAGAIVLCICGLLFGYALARFCGPRLEGFPGKALCVLTCGTCIFWQYYTWLPTPSYNDLTLCALLIAFSGLLLSTPQIPTKTENLHELIASSVVSAIGIALLALVKPTSCVAAIACGFVWVALIPPRWPFRYILLTTIIAAAIFAIVILSIHRDVNDFVQQIHAALATDPAFFKEYEPLRDVHGILFSIMAPFWPGSRWKIFPVVVFGFVVFAIDYFWSRLVLSATASKSTRQWIVVFCSAAVLSAIMAESRFLHMDCPTCSAGFRIWYFTFPLILAAYAVVSRRIAIRGPESGRSQIIIAAAILSAAPLVYSFGTANTLFLHMAHASVFWAASLLLVASAAPHAVRAGLFSGAAFLSAAVTVGLLIAVVLAPGGYNSLPLWKQTQFVALGPRHFGLMMDQARGQYITDLEIVADANGFKSGTTVIDLTNTGAGMVFAIGGIAAGLPTIPEYDYQKMLYTNAVLQTVPLPELARSWIMIAPTRYKASSKILQVLGLNFPQRYQLVGDVRNATDGLAVELWRPRSQATRNPLSSGD
jgi:hypothetical protein